MKIRKTALLAVLMLPLAAIPFRQANAATLTIVESVPEETNYGSTLTQRPQKVWLDMINNAKKTLDFEQYYITDEEGEALSPVMNAIKKAIERGVKVRFLAGPSGSMVKDTMKPLNELKKVGAETRRIDFGKAYKGGVQHSKFFIVDGNAVYVGSQNFDWRSLSQIHEVGVKIESERAAKDFGLIFEDDWNIAKDQDDNKKESRGLSKEDKARITEEGKAKALKIINSRQAKAPINAKNPEKAKLNGQDVTFSLAFSPEGFINKGFDSELSAILKIINGAKKSINGQVMTYHLDEYGSGRWEVLDKAFRAAGERGVQVNLVFADWNMGKAKADADVKSLAKAKNVNIKIASLKEHSKGCIPFARVQHSKYITADGNKSYITTSNWGPTYFTTTRNAAIIINGSEGAKVLEDVFGKIWNGPYVQPVDQDMKYKSVDRVCKSSNKNDNDGDKDAKKETKKDGK